MKKNLLKSLLICGVGLLLSGCDETDKLIGKDGMKCDNNEVVSLTEKILNNQIMKNSNLKLDINNIVVWDYNKVGRYECKAKVSGLLEKDIGGRWILPLYGLSVDKQTNKIAGWIKYNTYTTTTDSYYVEIQKLNK